MAEGYEPIPIGYSVSALSNSEYYNTSLSFVAKSGYVKVLQIMIGGAQTQIPQGTFTDIGTVPAGYEPIYETSAILFSETGRVLLQVKKTGVITAYRYTTGDFSGYHELVYI